MIFSFIKGASMSEKYEKNRKEKVGKTTVFKNN